MLASKPIVCKATSRRRFNRTAPLFLGNLGLFGVPQKVGRALGRNSASSIVPRRHPGCSHQRKRANNKRLADRRVGRFSISGDKPVAHPVRACNQPQDRQGARPGSPAEPARPRRRGDRINCNFAALHMSLLGTKLPCRRRRPMSEVGGRTDSTRTCRHGRV